MDKSQLEEEEKVNDMTFGENIPHQPSSLVDEEDPYRPSSLVDQASEMEFDDQ